MATPGGKSPEWRADEPQVDLSTVLATNYWSAAALHPGPDVSEGIDAFLERRPAVFNTRPPVA